MSIVDYQRKVMHQLSTKAGSTILLMVIVFPLLLTSSCTKQTDNSAQIAEMEKKYQDSISVLKSQLEKANAEIDILKFPADQRLSKIVELFNSQQYDKVRKGVSELKQVFPNAREIVEAEKYIAKIDAIEVAKKAEEERIKALGFKAITQRTSFDIDYNKLNISGISVGSTFTFDDYGSSYFYRTADRGSKYVSMSMSVTSSDHDPNLPELALYAIKADKMVLEGTFTTEFARWSDYGAYLGNYHDTRNDFSKVSTVKFKLGLQVNDKTLQGPYAIVVKKENVLVLRYERFNNPPYSYTGSASYPSTLTVNDFVNNFILVKITNLK